MFCHEFIELCPYRTDWTKRASGRLKDHSKLRSAQFSHLPRFQVGKIHSLIPDIPSGNKTVLSKQTHRRFDQRRFSAATFSYNSKDFTFFYRKTDIMYNPFSFITDIYMFITNDFRHFLYLPLRGSSQSLTVSPNRLNIITDTKIAHPGASVTQG